MSKFRYDWDEKKYERFLKEGRGKGEREKYNPWLHSQDLPSEGRVSRYPGPGWKTNRTHQLLSDNEKRCIYLFGWSDIVTDIREQYPLLEYEETIKIAEEAGIEYPRDKKSRFPWVLTTDFLLTVKLNNKHVLLARTFKETQELDDSRVCELFEIERRYWKVRGVDWGIITEKQIPRTFVDNIEWLDSAYNAIFKDLSLQDIYDISEMLKHYLAKMEGRQIRQVCTSLDLDMNLEVGTSLTLLRRLIAQKQIIVDMNTPIRGTSPVNIIKNITFADGGDIKYGRHSNQSK